jgi:hypothetical protein
MVRAYCHLCDEMRDALTPLAASRGLVIDERDVDADPALEAVWGDKVPVLLADGREVCRYRFDRSAFEAALAR